MFLFNRCLLSYYQVLGYSGENNKYSFFFNKVY